ncbi:hypothetical protein RAA17_04075 [Komagataeibacter rhaeticus]|nr:hypothetical protein [Komagataeibacter rhaeticus]
MLYNGVLNADGSEIEGNGVSPVPGRAGSSCSAAAVGWCNHAAGRRSPDRLSLVTRTRPASMWW